jgi:hypothetical protein
MPRMSGRSTLLASAETAVTAAAVRYPDRGARLPVANSQGWQAEAWRFYDIVGELRYGATYIANVMSRARLMAATVDPDGTTHVLTEGPAVDAISALTAKQSGQDSLIKSIAIHLVIAGECYLIGRTEEVTEVDVWSVFGVTEVSHISENAWYIINDRNQREKLPPEAVIIRIWRPHPRNHTQADSPVRALLPILSEIEYLTRHIFAQVRSRLAGAGIFEVPQGMTFPVKPGTEGMGTADQFMAMLGEEMIRPISDPADPASLVPIVVTSPDDLIGKMHLHTFWSPLDENAVTLRTEAIRRLALGMDIPPEVMLGQGTMNHWSGWLVDESSVKAHIEPLLAIVTSALTTEYLRPAVGSQEVSVIADTSQLRLRPDRSKEAVELYDRGEIDGQALRRETGFSEDDKPTEDEFKTWLLRKVASGSATPEQVAAALATLGVDVGAPSPAQETREARPDRTLDQHPTRDLPDTLAAAGQVLVLRALERAGNRMRSIYGTRPPGIAAFDVYRVVAVRNGDLDKVMEDAWGCLPQALDGFGCDVAEVQAALDAYTRGLLVSQRAHTYEAVRAALMVAA